MKDELFHDLSTSYKDVVNLIKDDRQSLAALPILTRMEYEAIPLVDCFEAVRRYNNSHGTHHFTLTNVMYILMLAKRLQVTEGTALLMSRTLAVARTTLGLKHHTISLLLTGHSYNRYTVKSDYNIGRMQFGVVNDNLVMAIKQNRIKGRIDPTMFPHNLPEVNLQMQETVLDFTETTHDNLLKLQEVLQPDASEPYYPNETGELPPNVFTPFNREYEAELHRRGWLPKDMWLSDVTELMKTDDIKTRRIWMSENEAMRGKQIESLYQTIRMDANEHSL